MTYNALHHGSIHPRRISVGGKTLRRREIYCVVHGFFDLVVFPESEFERRHASCDRRPRSKAELDAVVKAEVF